MKPTPIVAAFVLLLVCAFTSILAFAKTPAALTNQVWFEGVGSGTFNSKAMQFGFSVRCYGASCVGTLDLGGTSAGYVTTGTVTQLQQDTYMMSLSATPSISCSLANTPPITQGETNAVTMTCSSPAGSGISTDATIEVGGTSNGK